MTDDDEVFRNQSQAIGRFVTGYNKSVVMRSVTGHSLDIIGFNLDRIGESLSSVVSAFEEIRATSQTTSGNADRIDAMMDGVLTQNAKTGDGIVERMAEVEKASASAGRLSGLFASLSEKARSIESVTGSIRDVSDRTNILAINASIEAARAGAVGKGFRIIANEVRALAGQTGDFAATIESTIGEFSAALAQIMREVEGFTAMMASFRESFGAIQTGYKANAVSVDEAGKFLNQISGSIREETQALTEGLASLESISTALKDTQVVHGALMRMNHFLDSILEKEGGR